MAKQQSKKAGVQKKSNQSFITLLVVVGIAGVAIIGYLATRPGAKPLTVDPNIPAGTAEGYLLGSADAKVKAIEWGDFECPGCGDFTNVTEPDVRERLIKTGQVSLRFMDFPLPGHRNSWTAHIAAGCAGDQGKFWEMHDHIFAGQTEWNGEATTNPLKVLRTYATAVGVDLGKWDACVASQAPTARIKANSAEGVRRGVGGTPTFIIGNKQMPSGGLSYDQFKMWVDSALASLPKDPAAEKAPAPAAKKAPAGK